MNRRKELQNEFGVKGRTMGVFQIVNKRSGKRYVASSPTLDSAWQREKFMLDAGSHFNSALQGEYRDQAGADFEFEVLEKLEPAGPAGEAGGKAAGSTAGETAGNAAGEASGEASDKGPHCEAGARPAAGALNRSAVLSYRSALKQLERKWLDELRPYGPEGYNRPPSDG